MEEDPWNVCLCGECDIQTLLTVTVEGTCSRCKRLPQIGEYWHKIGKLCYRCISYQKTNNHPRPFCQKQVYKLAHDRKKKTLSKKTEQNSKVVRRISEDMDYEPDTVERATIAKIPKKRQRNRSQTIPYQMLREASTSKHSNLLVPKFTLNGANITFPSGTYPLKSLFAIADKIRPEIPGTGECGTEKEDYLERTFAWNQKWDEYTIEELKIDTQLSSKQIKAWLLKRQKHEKAHPPVCPQETKARDIHFYSKIWLLFGGEIERSMFQPIADWIGCDVRRVDDMVHTPGHLFDLLR